MDTARFDRLARTIARTRDRRAIIGLLAGLVLGSNELLGADDGGAAKKKTRKKCKPCQRKKRGKCRGKKPDGTPCGGGRECCDGRCVAECAANELRDPATCGCCLRAGEPCEPGPAACCSQSCVGPIGGPFFCSTFAP